MQNDVLREAFRKGVGIGRPDPGGGCGAAACSEVMTAAHSYSCNGGGQFSRRHNKVVFELKKMFQAAQTVYNRPLLLLQVEHCVAAAPQSCSDTVKGCARPLVHVTADCRVLWGCPWMSNEGAARFDILISRSAATLAACSSKAANTYTTNSCFYRTLLLLRRLIHTTSCENSCSYGTMI